MGNYDNEIKGQIVADFSIYGNHVASGGEQTEIKALLITAIKNLCIALHQKDVVIKVTDCSEAE